MDMKAQAWQAASDVASPLPMLNVYKNQLCWKGLKVAEKKGRRMASYQQNIIDIQAKLQGVISQKAWDVKRGIGSFVTMNFGQPLPPKRPNGRFSRGEWHLWVYGGEWRLEDEERVIVASEDDKKKIDTEIRCLEGQVLQSFEVMTPALDAVLTFEPNYVFRIFSIYSEETEDDGMDSWKLYTPDAGNVIVVHADGTWSYR